MHREQMILDLAPVVRRAVSKALARAPRDVAREKAQDFTQAAWAGAISAVSRYDPQRGPLEAFARPRIAGAIMDYQRSEDCLTRGQRSAVKRGEAINPSHVSIAAAAGIAAPNYQRDETPRDGRHQIERVWTAYLDGARTIGDVARVTGIDRKLCSARTTDLIQRGRLRVVGIIRNKYRDFREVEPVRISTRTK